MRVVVDDGAVAVGDSAMAVDIFVPVFEKCRTRCLFKVRERAARIEILVKLKFFFN